jgi:hypothetical protein
LIKDQQTQTTLTTLTEEARRTFAALYIWDEKTRTFRLPDGTQLTPMNVRAFVDIAVEAAKSEARSIAARFAAGEISIPDFELAMRALIKNEHLALAMIAEGGRDQMTLSDFGKVGAILRDQYGYLANFARQLERDEITLGDGFLARAESYAAFGTTVYERFVMDGMIEAGMTEVMNLLGAAERHCDECEELSDEWMPIDDMPPIGSRECGGRDCCSLIFRGPNAE